MTGILNILAGSISSAIKDGYFNLVSLLLPGDGTNGAQNNTFLDSSTNNFTITRNGNTTQGTFSPFSQTGWSGYFDGNGDYLTLANSSNFSCSGNFTIEIFAYPTAISNTPVIFDTRTASGNTASIYLYINTSGNIVAVVGGTTITSSSTYTVNSWYYIAIVRSSNSVTLYVNGTSAGTATISTNLSDTGMTIGAPIDQRGATATNKFTGYLSNFRFNNTTARTISSTPTSALSSDSGTTLLTLQSNRFVDNASSATITIAGTPSVQAFSPFAPTAAYSAATNGGSGYFDGTGDYLTVGAASDWTFLHNTTAAWTMEFWVYNTTTGSATTLLDTNASTTGSTGVTVQKTASEFINVFITYSSAGNNIVNGTSNITLKANAWNHVFISYNQSLANTNLVFYINGAAAGTANKTANTPSSGNPANALSIATYGAGAGQFFPGYIGSLRISNTVRSTPSSVPTSPYTSDANTKLLANFTNAGITDATAKSVIETVGTAQISTAQSKWGGSSILFDGAATPEDKLIIPISALQLIGTSDFTFECWVRPQNVSTLQTLITYGTGAFRIFINSTNVWFLNGAGSIINSNGSFTANNWFHVAVARKGSTGNNTACWVNGTRIAAPVANTSDFNSGTTIQIGGEGTSNLLQGYLQDVRLTKFARYDPANSTITVPTAAFPLS